MAERLITIFGGSGFLGRYVARKLAEKGDRVRIAVRHPNLAQFLQPLGNTGQIQAVQANVRNQQSVEAAVRGADIVINLVGILYESGPQKFNTIHAQGAACIAEACKKFNIRRLVQISAIGADPESDAKYARSKAAGEKAAKKLFPDVTIIRPSIVFGPEDQFFNRFAGLARLSPIMPLICGDTKFQPVYVGDVAGAIVSAFENDASKGKTYEVGGPRVYTFREILDYIMTEINTRRTLLPVPAFAAKIKAFFLQMLPGRPILTVDQVRSLGHDNVTAKGSRGLKDLGITPTSVEAIVPAYLIRFRPYGQFSSDPEP